jgi:CSLREA domain-containing protein
MKPLSRTLLVGVVSVAVTSLNPIPASAATITVNSAADPGDGICNGAECTLREAIAASNLSVGEADLIVFDVPGSAQITINVTAPPLPPINSPVTVDGLSDPNDPGRVELNGAAAGVLADGISINGENSTIKGLVIRNFDNDGIDISPNATGARIEGNFIGTNAAGTADAGNGGNGIDVRGAANVIGGAGLGNLVSGNGQNGSGSGISINGSAATANVVQGNFIGTSANGASPGIANDDHGIVITSSANNNTVGGITASLRNIISANNQDGIRLQGAASANTIQGNFIGTDSSGISALPNLFDGIGLRQSTSGNTLGGTGAGAGNVISGNTQDGIQVGTTIDPTPTKNAILGNSIFSNGTLGINLHGSATVDPNDSGDADTGSNNVQNYPVLTSVFSATRVLISGTLNTQANKAYRLEFFANAVCDGTNGEGQTFLGTTNVTTDAAGNAAFSVSLPAGVPAGQVITATATDPDNNTSEFSACKAVIADVTPPSTPMTSAGGTFQKDITFTVSWSTSTDDLSGIFGYEVRYREAPYNGGFGGFVNWQSTTATSATFTGTPGTTYCFSARAIDGAGNASPYSADGCTSVPVDNTSFKHRGRWSKRTGAGYYLNTFSRTKQRGARLTLPAVQAKVLSIIVSKCRRCGVIKVFFKGNLLKRIVLRTKAASRQKLRFVKVTTFASPQTGTVRVSVVSRRKLVIVEGLGISAV